MRTLHLALLAAILAGCGKKSSDSPLLGHWQGDGEWAYEFFSDGTAVQFRPKPQAPLEVRYVWTQPSFLRLELPAGGSLEYQVALSGDALVLTYPNGPSLSYRRVRKEDPNSDARRSARCASNLARLWVDSIALLTKDRSLDKMLGGAFWVKVARSHEILACPFAKEGLHEGQTHYRGPARRYSELGDGNWIGSCLGRHPGGETILLRKSGDVYVAQEGTELRETAKATTIP